MTTLARALALGLIGALAAAARPTRAQPAPPPPEPPPLADPAADLGLGDVDESLLFDAVPSVTGASKYDQRATVAPAAVTVITADDIARHGWRTLDDVLASVRGFYRTDDRVYPAIGVRGFSLPGDYGSRLLLLVDGTRTNDVVYDGAPISYMLPVPIGLVERVEVIRGPSSALYGSNALFAVINVVTRRGRDLAGAAVTVEGGTRDGLEVEARGGERLASGVEYRLGATFHLAPGADYDFSAIADASDVSGRVRGADDELGVAVAASVAHRQWALSAAFSLRDKTVPDGAWYTALGTDDTTVSDRYVFVSAEYADHLPSGLDVAGRLTFNHYDYAGNFYYRSLDGADPPGIVEQREHDLAQAEVVRLEVTANHFVHPDLRLAVGAELDLSLRVFMNAHVEVDGQREEVVRDERSRGAAGAHAQLEWTPTPAVTLDGAVRVDYRPALGALASPRVAFILAPAPTTVFKAIVGRAFRAPNGYELSYGDGVTMKAPRALDPETVTSCELTWEQWFGPAVHTIVDAFLMELDDLVVLTSDPADGLLVYANRGGMTSVGVEGELGVELDALHLALSGSYQRAAEAATRLPGSPLFLGTLRVAVPIAGPALGVALEARYLGPRTTLAGDEVDPVLLVNLALTSEELIGGLSMRLAFDNLLDYRYADPASEEHRLDTIPQPGFGVRLRLGYRF